MKKAVYFSILAIFVLGLSACDQIGLKPSSTPAVKGPVLARAGDWVLTKQDFDKQVDTIVQANKGDEVVPVGMLGLLARTFIDSYITDIDFGSVEGKQLYLDLLVNLELLAFEAKERGLEKKSDIAKDIRRSTVEILDFNLLNDVFKKITVTSIEIEEFYENEYKRTLESIDQRKVREIIVDSQAKATGILVELLQGADFSRVAVDRSIADTASKGGDLGYIVYQPNSMFKEFWEAVLVLNVGEVSRIFKDPLKNEYYIVKIEDIKKGEPESLSSIYDQLEFLLKQRKSIEAIENLVDTIKEKTEVKINSNLLN